MIELNTIKDKAHLEELSNTDRLLLCLAFNANPKKHNEIKEIARNAGLSSSILKNITSYLKKAKGLVIITPQGWELTKTGIKRVEELTGISESWSKVTSRFNTLLDSITNTDSYEFIQEAIICFENRLLRSSVVLSWVGAISLLQDHVIREKLAEFNYEVRKRDSKWKDAKTKDDLGRIKEYDFLQILVSLSIIGKNVREELEVCLKLRNGCGHPNTLKIGEYRVSAHLETLVLNVYTRF